MADLTSTVTITGVINGRRIAVSSTCTYEDIVDVGTTQDAAYSPSYTTMGFGTNTALVFSQDCPDYLLAINRSTSEAAMLGLEISGGAATYLLHLPPGGFAVLNQSANGEGMIMVDNSATNIDLLEVQKAEAASIPTYGFVCNIDILAATKATT